MFESDDPVGGTVIELVSNAASPSPSNRKAHAAGTASPSNPGLFSHKPRVARSNPLKYVGSDMPPLMKVPGNNDILPRHQRCVLASGSYLLPQESGRMGCTQRRLLSFSIAVIALCGPYSAFAQVSDDARFASAVKTCVSEVRSSTDQVTRSGRVIPRSKFDATVTGSRGVRLRGTDEEQGCSSNGVWRSRDSRSRLELFKSRLCFSTPRRVTPVTFEFGRMLLRPRPLTSVREPPISRRALQSSPGARAVADKGLKSWASDLCRVIEGPQRGCTGVLSAPYVKTITRDTPKP